MGMYRIGGLPDWGIYRIGIYRIGARQSAGGRGVGSKTPIGSASVAMAAAIVTIVNVVMAAVVEPQHSWS